MNTYLKNLGITKLNEMQQTVLSAAREKSPIRLLSPTGSGKTIAYLLAILFRFKSDTNTRCALVIVPSRELAQQSEAVLKNMKTPYASVCLHGGRTAMEEHRRIREVQPQFIFATPGRLLDHLQKGNFRGESVDLLVLDEFDKCLEIGFKDEMENIVGRMPALKDLLLTSATDSLLPDFLIRMPLLKSRPFRTLNYLEGQGKEDSRVKNFIVNSPIKDKLDTLARLLSHLNGAPSIIFVAHRESAERVGAHLASLGIMVRVYHGGLDQDLRERALFQFRCGAAVSLVATDLAARGLDIPEVRAVIHYHQPADEAACIHRTGRTARWDQHGEAYLLLGPEERVPDFWTDSEILDVDAQAIKPINSTWQALYIGKGKKAGISKTDILGFLCKIGGCCATDVGRIEVRQQCSYVAVRRHCVKHLLSRVTGEKIKGIKTIFEEMKK